MASLFDQYEQLTSVSTTSLIDHSNQNNSLINIRSDSETNIFSKYKIDFSPPEVITHLVVSNNYLIMALKNKTILRIDLMHPNQPNEIDLTRFLGDKSHLSRVQQLFLDPTGKHCIISCISTDTQLSYENLYLSKKVQQTSKMKGHIISSIGWNYGNSNKGNPNSTSNILIGTAKGLIFETELLLTEENKFFPIGGPEQYWKQAFDLGAEAGAVFAIEFHKMNQNSVNDVTYFIIVTTKNRLYQFVGNVSNSNDSPFLYHIFNTYSNQFQDMPGNMAFSKLDFYYPNSYSIPKSFGWLTEPGVLFGQIDLNADQTLKTTVISDTTLITYRKDNEMNHSINENPISLVLTQFHVLILFKNRLKVICVLNEEIVFEDFFTETYGKLVGIAKDAVKGTVWVFTELAVYRYKIINEDRNIWQIYLAKQDFNLAKHFAKSDPIKVDKVICEEAQHYFNNKNYEKSASLYALSHKSFEEIALKFLQINEEEALKQFLICKLDTMSERDITQSTILLLWLLEILLNQMGSLKNAGQQSSEKYQLIQAEFQSLLSQNKIKNCLNKCRKAIYDLISSHGIESNLIYFAVLMQDFDRVIEYYLQHKNYREALNVLKQQGVTEMFYRFSPAIIQELPSELITVLIQFAPQLDSSKLIPALVQQHSKKGNVWDEKQGLETIRYLEHCAYSLGFNDPIIHNYLLALYAQMQSDKLMTYLSMKGQDESSVPYDIKYASRVCSELGLEKACVHLYSTMGMFEEAVNLALTFDIDLAKQNADKSELNDELRKKLWLKIAKHVITEEMDVKTATKILKECELLKIEDILPFFPDFITIDHFKEAICSSLQEYNRNIESLKEDMKSATESAQEIREEIKSFRNKFTIVRTQDKCIVCSYAILTRAFYAFPCGHLFHSDCLISEVMPYLKQSIQNRVEEIKRNLVIHQSQQIKSNNDVLGDHSNSIAAANGREKLLTELDDIVASECFYCGDIMISSIDQPFILPEEANLVMEGWE